MMGPVCSWHIKSAQEMVLFVVKKQWQISKPSFSSLVVVLRPAFGNHFPRPGWEKVHVNVSRSKNWLPTQR